MNVSDEAEAEISECLYILKAFWGANLGGFKAVTASDVAECSSIALGFLISEGSDGKKDLIGKYVAGLIFFDLN